MAGHLPAVMSRQYVWRQTPDILNPNCTEEAFKKTVTDVIDEYAPTGRFAWFDCVLVGADNVEEAEKKNQWLREVLYSHGCEAMSR